MGGQVRALVSGVPFLAAPGPPPPSREVPVGGGERLPATHMGSLLINTQEESYPSWLFTDADPRCPS